jgi:hypothetical protein
MRGLRFGLFAVLLAMNAIALKAASPSGNGYLFGNFVVTEGYKDSGIYMVLLEQNTKSEIRIQFRKAKDNVVLSEVPPGTYKIDDNKELLTVMDDVPSDERGNITPLIDNLKAGFQVIANEAIYLGDFSGFNNLAYGGSQVAIISVTNNYDATKEKAISNYPNLKYVSAITECK